MYRRMYHMCDHTIVYRCTCEPYITFIVGHTTCSDYTNVGTIACVNHTNVGLTCELQVTSAGMYNHTVNVNRVV
jgi:hypothetical protein